jgi:hypothetical protein
MNNKIHFVSAVRVVTTSTSSSKYVEVGRIKFRWKLDLPTVVIRSHVATNMRSESPDFSVECSANAQNMTLVL